MVGHESKCAHIHGHSYKVHITAEASDLDEVGRVIDFGALKARVGNWIDENWDHAMILGEEDIAAWHMLKNLHAETSSGTTRPRIFRLPNNPTAENLADYLLNTVCPKVLQATKVRVFRVVIEETENCRATALLDKYSIPKRENHDRSTDPEDKVPAE